MHMSTDTQARWDSSTPESREANVSAAQEANAAGREAISSGNVSAALDAAESSAALSGATGEGY